MKICLLGINYAPQKQDRWGVVQEANKLCQGWLTQNPNWHWVDVNKDMFDSAGKLKIDMFVSDGLHLTENAYTNVFRPKVMEKLQEIWP